MSEDRDPTRSDAPRENWVSRWTTLGDIERTLIDKPSSGFEAWMRTTAGVVVMLLALQVITGLLLAFYYVPSTESAHTSVDYIEKVVPAGSWIRSLHHYGSQWLTLALVLHLAQMFWRATYRRRPVSWMASVILLGLILAAGATGYSLPWDQRAFFGTRVTEGIAGGLPFIGSAAREWMLGGPEISPITLARFFALHAMIIPVLILTVLTARLFVFRERAWVSAAEERRLEVWMHRQVLRNAIAAGLVFLALAIYARIFFAPLGTAADTAASGYLPRPGAQFLWLFQMLKYLPGRAASVVAVALPGLILFGLAMLPFLNPKPLRKVMAHPRRTVGTILFALGFLLVTVLTILAYVKDATDPLIRATLRRQQAEEQALREKPFTPVRTRSSESVVDPRGNEDGGKQGKTNGSGGNTSTNTSTDTSSNVSSGPPPESYSAWCSACHGTRGQGVKGSPKLLGVGSKERRTVEDIIGLLNDPVAYGLEPPMKSYATKLTEQEKREIAEWTAALK